MRTLLPPQLQVFVRDWLSSNNVLLKSRDGHVLIDSGHTSHAPLTLALLAPIAALVKRRSRFSSIHIAIRTTSAATRRLRCDTAARLRFPQRKRLLSSAGMGRLCSTNIAIIRSTAFHVGFGLAAGSTQVWGELEWQALAAPARHGRARVLQRGARDSDIRRCALAERIRFRDAARDRSACPARTRATIEMLAGLDVSVVIPGHGEPFRDLAAALERARSTLDVLERDTLRLVRHALKANLMFTLLDRRRIALADLPAYLDKVGLYRDFNAVYFRLPPAQFAALIVAELERSGRSKGSTAGSRPREGDSLEWRAGGTPGWETGASGTGNDPIRRLFTSGFARDEQKHDATPLRSRPARCKSRESASVLTLLDHPAVQGGLAPLVIALTVAAVFARTRFAWLAILGGYATMVALSTGFSFSPLTVARKTILVGVIAPILGVVLDVVTRSSKTLAAALVVAAGAVSIWIFMTILKQRDTTVAIATGTGVALFVAILVALMLRLRGDGLRTGAAVSGLGVATGIAGLLSASIGYLVAGVSIAAAPERCYSSRCSCRARSRPALPAR
jgi:hypothetical protein